MKYRQVLPYVIFAIFLVGAFVLLVQPSPPNNQASIVREVAKVIRVVDGDTIKVLINNKEDTVRLIGIDSPEVVDERKPVQCFGKEASSKAKEILNRKIVVLESDSTQGDRDEYGRLLRYVFLESINFNKFMISEGFAREYTFKGRVYRYQPELINAEKEAKRKNKGLWNSC